MKPPMEADDHPTQAILLLLFSFAISSSDSLSHCSWAVAAKQRGQQIRVSYYLKRRVCGKPFTYDNIYRSEPWYLPSRSRLNTRDLQRYFFSALDKKYQPGAVAVLLVEGAEEVPLEIARIEA
ncbi:hypothetical protein ACLOJK_025278 [Asimina triloba]